MKNSFQVVSKSLQNAYTTAMGAQISWILLILFGIFAICAIFWVYKKRQPTAQNIQNTLVKEGNFTDIFGHKLHYIQKGSGEDILLLHGIGASHFVWRFILSPLAKTHRVTALDIMGFGLSDKPEAFAYDLDSQCDVILEFIKKMGIKKCALVGSSMGGMIALRLAQKDSQMFPKVVAVSPAYDPRIAFFDLNRISFLSPMVTPLINEQFVRQIMRRVYSNQSLVTDEAVRIYTEPYRNRMAISSFVKSFKLLKDPRVMKELSQIQSQVLILWGAKDKIIPVKFAQAMKKKLDHARLEIHPNAGHHVHEDDPTWTLEHVQRFLE